MAFSPQQKQVLEHERKEAKAHARRVEREVKRVIFSRRKPCRTHELQCGSCGFWARLLIERPTGAHCPECGSNLSWKEVDR